MYVTALGVHDESLGEADMMSNANSDSPNRKTESKKSITFKRTDNQQGFKFRNYYCCPNDGTTWHDDWSATCNDRCPTCWTEIEPYESEDI